MRILNSSFAGLAVLSSYLTRGVAAGGNTDTCAQITNQELEVPQPLIPQNLIPVGLINACICTSDVPSFVATDLVASAGVRLAGQAYVVNAITQMVQRFGQVCNFPDHAVDVCTKASPCGFTCKDGYTPSPSTKPTQCVCNQPYTECNGKCGLYQGCPSAYPYHAKRDSLSRDLLCPKGMVACGIWGRNARTWECIDTMSDLESCGGCMIQLPGIHRSTQSGGEDCTAIMGVSDVSCVGGECVVHKCEAGYDFEGGECVYNEDRDPVILAAQFGLESTLL